MTRLLLFLAAILVCLLQLRIALAHDATARLWLFTVLLLAVILGAAWDLGRKGSPPPS